MNIELKKDIEAAVSEIFSQKEEAEQKARTEEALQKSAETITKLTEALEARNVSEEEHASEVESLNEKIETLTSELEAAKTEVASITEKLAESEKMIEEMNKDKAAELRMSELEEAGVALSNREAQTAKVREMAEEDFATYKAELVDIRNAVKAELEKNAEVTKPVEEAEEEVNEEENAEEDTETAEEENKEETAEEETAEEDADETIPAEIDHDKAVAGALNLEVGPSDDLLAKYRKFGEAMASRMKKDK
jgi:chromosome segregation ATPase